MTWVYRFLLVLNLTVLIISSWVGLSMLLSGFDEFAGVKAAFVTWPFLQLGGIWFATRANSRGSTRLAAGALVIQLVLMGGVTVAWLALVALPSA